MAIFHTHFSKVQRSKGQNAIASAAYIGGICLQKLDGEKADYSKKKGVCGHRIIMPTQFDSVKTPSAQWVWHEAEGTETRKNSTTARRGDLALPHELTQDECFAVGYSYAQDIADRYGVIAQIDFHDLDSSNPHIDMQWTTRIFDGEKLGAKTRILDDKRTGSEEIIWMREQWATRVNEVLAKYGKSIDHRSYADQGSKKLPTKHLGRKCTALERKGIKTERGIYNDKACEYNTFIEQRNTISAEIVSLQNELKEVQHESREHKTPSLSRGCECVAERENTSIYIKNRSYADDEIYQIKRNTSDAGDKIQPITYFGGTYTTDFRFRRTNAGAKAEEQQKSRAFREITTDSSTICGISSSARGSHQKIDSGREQGHQQCLQPTRQPSGGQSETQRREREPSYADVENTWREDIQDRELFEEEVKFVESIADNFEKIQILPVNVDFNLNVMEGITSKVQKLANKYTLESMANQCFVFAWDSILNEDIQQPRLEQNLVPKIKAKMERISGQMSIRHVEQLHMLNSWDELLATPMQTLPFLQIQQANNIPEVISNLAGKNILNQMDILIMEQAWNTMLSSPSINYADIASTIALASKVSALSTEITFNKINEILDYQSQWLPINDLNKSVDIQKQLFRLRAKERAVKRQVKKLAGLMLVESLAQNLIATSYDAIEQIEENNENEYNYNKFKAN